MSHFETDPEWYRKAIEEAQADKRKEFLRARAEYERRLEKERPSQTVAVTSYSPLLETLAALADFLPESFTVETPFISMKPATDIQIFRYDWQGGLAFGLYQKHDLYKFLTQKPTVLPHTPFTQARNEIERYGYLNMVQAGIYERRAGHEETLGHDEEAFVYRNIVGEKRVKAKSILAFNGHIPTQRGFRELVRSDVGQLFVDYKVPIRLPLE